MHRNTTLPCYLFVVGSQHHPPSLVLSQDTKKLVLLGIKHSTFHQSTFVPVILCLENDEDDDGAGRINANDGGSLQQNWWWIGLVCVVPGMYYYWCRGLYSCLVESSTSHDSCYNRSTTRTNQNHGLVGIPSQSGRTTAGQYPQRVECLFEYSSLETCYQCSFGYCRRWIFNVHGALLGTGLGRE